MTRKLFICTLWHVTLLYSFTYRHIKTLLSIPKKTWPHQARTTCLVSLPIETNDAQGGNLISPAVALFTAVINNFKRAHSARESLQVRLLQSFNFHVKKWCGWIVVCFQNCCRLFEPTSCKNKNNKPHPPPPRLYKYWTNFHFRL